jgi:hypothetical protein
MHAARIVPASLFLLLLGACAQFERNLHLTYEPARYPTFAIAPVEHAPGRDLAPGRESLFDKQARAGVGERLRAKGYAPAPPDEAALRVHIRWWTNQQRDPSRIEVNVVSADQPPVVTPELEKRAHLHIYFVDTRTDTIVWERWSIRDASVRTFGEGQLNAFLDIILEPFLAYRAAQTDLFRDPPG